MLCSLVHTAFRSSLGMNIYTALCLGYKASFINLMQKIRLDLLMYAIKFKMREILAFKNVSI